MESNGNPCTILEIISNTPNNSDKGRFILFSGPNISKNSRVLTGDFFIDCQASPVHQIYVQLYRCSRRKPCYFTPNLVVTIYKLCKQRKIMILYPNISTNITRNKRRRRRTRITCHAPCCPPSIKAKHNGKNGRKRVLLPGFFFTAFTCTSTYQV